MYEIDFIRAWEEWEKATKKLTKVYAEWKKEQRRQIESAKKKGR